MIFYNLFIYDSSKNLVYTKFNFNFDLYKIDFDLSTDDKNLIFEDFWNKAGFDFSKPYVLDEKFLPYFSDLNENILSYIDAYGCIHGYYLAEIVPKSFISNKVLFDNQFDLVYYNDDQVRYLQDFYYDDVNNIYTKYNFDFDNYSKDFQIYGKKLLIFTDFVIRNFQLLNNHGIYEPFKKYFYTFDKKDLVKYLNYYGVLSVSDFVYKRLNNIDFSKLIELNPTIQVDPKFVKEYYIQTGQFELLNIPFIQIPQTNINIAKQSTCIVITDIAYGTGVLYNYFDDNIYLVSTYHLLDDTKDQFYIYVTLQTVDENSFDNKTITAQFRVIGIERTYDIFVARFDKTDYNIKNNIDISSYPLLRFDINTDLNNGSNVVSIGNFNLDDLLIPYFGKVIDNDYPGLPNDYFRPPSICIQSYMSSSSSGSPLFLYNNNNEPLKLVGLISSKSVINNNVTIAYSGKDLSAVVDLLINNFRYYEFYYPKDLVILNNAIKFGLQWPWLGAMFRYNVPYFNDNNITNDIKYNGGILITKFILGFDFVNKRFITSAKELNKKDIFKIEGPLLNTKMYSKFLESNSPIVIKSIYYFDSIYSVFTKLNLGVYSTQKYLSLFISGFSAINAKFNDPIYANPYSYIFPSIKFDYYWYNGENWVFETEIIEGNGPNMRVEYKDNTGKIYYQHKLEFPLILVDFVKYFYPHLYTNKYNELLETIEECKQRCGGDKSCIADCK
jgi:hypothetical protein